MSTITRFSLISLLALAACNKESDPVQPAPVASFSVVGATSTDVIKVGTYDPIRVTNTSTKATTYTWSLGNDSTKTGADPGLLRYPKAGTYSLTLTAQSKDGQKTSISRTVRVLDRVVKQIVILNTRFEAASTPIVVRPAVQAVLRLGPNQVSYPTPTNRYASYDAPILFRSPLVSNFTNDQLPYIFPVTDRLVLSLPALEATVLSLTKLGYTGVGYGLELYVQDATGTYLASSSYQPLYMSQISLLNWQSDIQNNKFVARYSNIELRCQYE